jgi:sulfate-transporting ATPase
VVKDVTLAFLHGAKIGVLGTNGSGKSTLLKIMAGLDTRFIGDAQLAAWATVGYLSQEPELDEAKDVRGNVEDGVRPTREMLDRFNAISMELADPDAADRMDELLEAMDALRLPPGDADVSTLSGGERRRVALCRLLLAAPDLLLLDEPTNHLDAESVAWLERFLGEYPGTVVAVTHDRYFLDNVAGWILEIDRTRCIPFEGNYSSWLDQKQQRLALEEKQDSARQKTLAKELEWIRMTPKAKHQRTKARLSAYERLLAEDQTAKYDPSEIHIPAGRRLGDVVVQAQDVSKGYGDRLLIEDLSFDLPPGGIVGVIGPNGAGKTTLFRMIAGQETADSGELRRGDTVDLAYVDQSRADLDDSNTVWKEISDGLDLKKVGDLSGGERNRLHLAKLLRSGGNLLLLDEPTNDLDVDTLRALEDALVDFAGCAVVISHDRWFLDRITTHILAFEGDSQVTWFEGTYAEYERHRRETLGEEALRPHRLRTKPLLRS